jgi:hypothetical protein
VDARAADLGRGQQREPVRAETEERDVAQVEQPGPAHHDVQPDGQQGDHQRVDPHLELEATQADRREQRPGQPGDGQPGPPPDPLGGPLGVAQPRR